MKSEYSLEYKLDNNKYNYQKKKSQEIDIKSLTQDFTEIKNETKNLLKSQTIKVRNISENKNQKKIRKKTTLKKETKKTAKKNKFNSFFTICITTILGYFLKYFINMIIVGVFSISGKNNIPLIVHVIKNEIKDIKCESENDFDCYEFFINNKNGSFINSSTFFTMATHISDYDDTKSSFYIMAICYAISVILSIILYSIFVCIFTKNVKEKNINGDKFRVCEICGYTIYSEDIILNLKPPCCECCKLICCGTCHNCLNMMVGSLLCCLDDEDKDEIDICGCCKCCDKEKIKYKKNKEFFCYCYQAKRKQNWFNKFITSETQKKIFPYMLEYFYLQFLTIAFEHQYSEFSGNTSNQDNMDENNNREYIFTLGDLYFICIFIGTFFLFFFFTFSFNSIINLFNESNKTKGINFVKKISNGILDGAHGILIFNGAFSLVISALYLSNKYDDIFKTHNLIFVPILMNKFYYFTLIFFCVSFSEEKKKFEIISGSTLISIYLTIWDLIISLIRNHSSLYALYITQIVFSSIPSLVLIGFIIIVFCAGTFGESFCSERLKSYFCLLSYCFCFGGFWYKEDTCDKIKACNCECCQIDCFYCFEFLDYCDCCDCFMCCSCCDCCTCYDCCGCCDCFYCCGDECSCDC